ncbi:30S ribosomal protein S18 [Thermomicrobium roseum]|jgi:small subunit ribosomal protein S18|uniref:Small ribosomal subunit protein bS18 n=1 Tax=Thermomicrobium roseum (strain ATCC 27502 / DSM 5159 / P-2) TaxID=309801 RepID=B9L1I7_THERP|nr:30S ribosomal protein S18 [Thermomicrobium roseum DSM 5159]
MAEELEPMTADDGATEQTAEATGESGRPARSAATRYYPRKKVCSFCMDGIKKIDYKDFGRLRRYLSPQAKIEPRRATGTCAKHQRQLARAIKRARHLALLPFVPER